MFRIKICGVKRKADLQAAAQAGADAVGLNFYRQSIRYVDANLADELAADASELGLTVVGVFVDEPVDSILALSDRLHLDYVQLHGNEPITAAERLIDAGDRVLRAVRLHLDDWSQRKSSREWPSGEPRVVTCCWMPMLERRSAARGCGWTGQRSDAGTMNSQVASTGSWRAD